tara:strand:- start:1766 stop:2650 length:885 start_codon:yes stop_codon:yes gene_type:complete
MVVMMTSISTACAGVNRRVAAPVESFTLLSSSYAVEICVTEETAQDPRFIESNMPRCSVFESQSVASGSIIRHYKNPSNGEDQSLILSVAHWCDRPDTAAEALDMLPNGPKQAVMAGVYRISRVILASEYVVDNSGAMHNINRHVAVDNNVDVCLIEAERIDAPTLQIARSNPEYGTRVLNMGAPWGYYDPPNVFIDEGIYLGECRQSETCRIRGEFSISGIYAGPGSSGSPILARHYGRWQIVGIIHAVRIAPFGGTYLPMGASVSQIREVIDREFIPYLEGTEPEDTSEDSQ